VSAALITAALLVALGDLALVVASWKSRTVLGGVLGASSLLLVGFAVLRGATRGIGEYTIVIAGVTLVIGTACMPLGKSSSAIGGPRRRLTMHPSLARVAPNPGSAHVDPAVTRHELSPRLVLSSRGA
jgi:hypothetical protein